MNRRFALIFLFLIGLFSASFGQSYDKAFGIRVGSKNGVTLKGFLHEHVFSEGILAYHQGGAQVIGIMGLQTEVGYRTGFYLMAGVGAHAGFRELFNKEVAAIPTVGADVLLGVEYHPVRSSMVLSFDVKPQVDFIGEMRISGNQAGASIRFLLD